MPVIKLVISDLHLADGHPILDCFGEEQQAALEGLLQAACGPGPLGSSEDIELIINGDCFDFLVTDPFTPEGIVDVALALNKAEKIIAAHPAFFEALRNFLQTAGRHITFIIGNHDIELCFVEVQQRIREAIVGTSSLQKEDAVVFCPTRSYQPLPDVYIEHGNHYDFWNQSIEGIWDTQGQLINTSPKSIGLPIGSRYFQAVTHRISTAYPYFDHFEPSMNSMRQIALLCLLNPDIVIDMAYQTMQLLSQPRKALANLAPGEERIPAALFEQAIMDFAAFQQDMAMQKSNQAGQEAQFSPQEVSGMLMEMHMLRQALTLPEEEAVTAICTPTTYQMGESVALGMRAVLKKNANLRYALAGHTHMVRIAPVSSGTQSYLNTASWTRRLALPAPGEITPELIAWLRQPDWQDIPLRDVSQLIFAMIYGAPDGQSSASLCVWEGGIKGTYRVLA